jgi:hypothetical protein
MILPRSRDGVACTVGLEVASPTIPSNRRHFDPASDQRVMLALDGHIVDSFLDDQPAQSVTGRALQGKGGPLDFAHIGPNARQRVQITGGEIDIQTVSLSDADPDGALRLGLMMRSAPTVKVDGKNVGIVWSLALTYKIWGLLCKLSGH